MLGAVRRRVESWYEGLLEPTDLDTEGEVFSDALGFTDPTYHHYQRSRLVYLHRVLRKRAITPADVFLDIGCGKGRMLYAAARFPFGRVIGIDLAPQLVAEAEANLARHRDRLRCQDVRAEVADVLTYRVPDDVTYAYLYNPFTGPTFDACMARLTDSLDRAPRRLSIIYANPEMHDAVLSTGRFSEVRRWSNSRGGRDRTQQVVLYESR